MTNGAFQIKSRKYYNRIIYHRARRRPKRGDPASRETWPLYGQWREVSRLHEIKRDFSPSRQLHPLECTRQEIAVAIRRMTLGFFIFWVKTVKSCVKVRFYTQRNATNQILNLVKKFKKPQCDLFSFVEKDCYVEIYLFHWLLKR